MSIYDKLIDRIKEHCIDKSIYFEETELLKDILYSGTIETEYYDYERVDHFLDAIQEAVVNEPSFERIKSLMTRYNNVEGILDEDRHWVSTSIIYWDDPTVLDEEEMLENIPYMIERELTINKDLQEFIINKDLIDKDALIELIKEEEEEEEEQ